jgi:hypothetical protein
MRIILERFEMKRVCLGMRKRGYQLSSSCGHHNQVILRFLKISKSSMDRYRRQVETMNRYFNDRRKT